VLDLRGRLRGGLELNEILDFYGHLNNDVDIGMSWCVAKLRVIFLSCVLVVVSFVSNPFSPSLML